MVFLGLEELKGLEELPELQFDYYSIVLSLQVRDGVVH